MQRTFTIEIKLGNAEMNTPEHVGKALEYIAERLKRGADMGNIKDVNGNNVGTFYGDFELDDEE
jgi:hypothetical protein